MGKVTPHFQELYDWLRDNRPDILEWCKDQARWHKVPLAAIITWEEGSIREMMQQPPRRKQNETV